LHGLGGGSFRQRFDHPALTNLAMPAGIERVLKFTAQGGELGNAAVNVATWRRAMLSTSAQGR
jgi:hypothetical protein